MSIYSTKKSTSKKRINYRKIYERHYGPTPRDAEGRKYDIHHIDGDHTNNDVTNLVALSIQDHYDIHSAQGEDGACQAIAIRMKLSPEEISDLAKKSNAKRVEEGSHNFLGGDIARDYQNKLVEEGSHPWLGPEQNKKLIAAGIHPLVGPENNRRRNKKMLEEGTHPLVGGAVQRKNNAERIANKTHNFLGSDSNNSRLKNGTHASQIKVCCVYCRIVCDKANFGRSHGDKCLLK